MTRHVAAFLAAGVLMATPTPPQDAASGSPFAPDSAEAVKTFLRVYSDSPVSAFIRIAQTPQGDYVLTTGFEVIRLDVSGNVLWAHRYSNASIQRVVPLANGDLLVGGSLHDVAPGASGLWVSRLDAAGNPLWDRSYNSGLTAGMSDLQPTADGGSIAAGTIVIPPDEDVNNLWYVKLDASGNLQWETHVGPAISIYAAGIRQTPDGGYIAIAGDPLGSSSSDADYWMIRLSATGTVRWQKGFGGNGHDVPVDLAVLSDGIMTVGTYQSGAGGFVPWVLKLGFNGQLSGPGKFQRTYTHGAYAGAFGNATAVQPTSDGGAVVSGYVNYATTPYADAFLLKLASSGSIQWQANFSALAGADSHLWSVAQTADGGYVGAGFTNGFGLGNSLFVLKTNAKGGLGAPCQYLSKGTLVQADVPPGLYSPARPSGPTSLLAGTARSQSTPASVAAAFLCGLP